MIRINLARKRKAGGGGGGLGGLDLKNLNFAAILEKLKSGGGGGEGKKFDLNGPIPRIIIALIAVYFVDDTLTGYRTDALAVVQKELAAIEKEKSTVQGRLAKIKGYEPIKKQLESDEIAIRTKLEVVSRLLENRNAPAKMMMQIAQSIPDEVWLTNLRVDEKAVILNGATPGYNQVADFLKSLNNTSQFTNITLNDVKENASATKDQLFQNFELKAARR